MFCSVCSTGVRLCGLALSLAAATAIVAQRRAVLTDAYAQPPQSPQTYSPQPLQSPQTRSPQPPQTLFQDLFAAVQSSRLYPDSKVFPDATPKAAPADILADYHASRPQKRQALKSFVEQHFSLPVDAIAAPLPPYRTSDQASLGAHIDALWNPLTRTTTTVPPYSSLLALPRPYVVPGGRFRELYYWDSYFTMLGLSESGRTDLLEDMVQDFAQLIDRYGHVPNGTRTYYLSRSQPPFFFAMLTLLTPDDPARSLARFLPQLKKEYAFWMQGASHLRRGSAHRRVVALADGSILNRYWDDRPSARDESYREDWELARTTKRAAPPLFRDIRAAAESGWDFSSRWFADTRTRATIDTTQIIPVDLNSLLFGLENAIRSGCARAADSTCADEFKHRAEARRRAIDRYLWDAAAGSYEDYRWTRALRVPGVTAAGVYPLFTAAASDSQAAALAKIVSRVLLKPGGIVTTPLATGQQWDAPNGWAPLQWIAVSGLNGYGQRALAEAIACRWMHTVARVYAQTGKLVEKYDVIATDRSGGGGEYPRQDGFGWTNGVMRKLMALYPADAALSDAGQCPKP